MSSPRRPVRAALATALLTGVGTTVAAVPAPAAAEITTLCKGFKPCEAKGLSTSGYDVAWKTSFWRMYTGHNCTNYAAFRMVKAGMANTRPWSGGGNATAWGTKMSRITNDVPRVGAIAWWTAGRGPAGSAGHVAYVERVISANEVILSQDVWGGDFSWSRVTRTGDSWPNGFIHFRDVQLRASRGAAVTGVAKVGSALRATAPTWSPAATRSTYQWFQGGTAIPGATGASYVLTNDQLGKALSVRVVGTRYGYPAAVSTSAATPAVLPGSLRATTAPTARGTSKLGSRLTATPGAWTPRPDAVRFRWLSSGRPIAGATGSSYVPTPSMVGRPLAVQVVASRRGYDDVVRTISWPTVAPGVLARVGAPAISSASRDGQTVRLRMPRVPANTRAALVWVNARDGRVLQRGGYSYRLTSRDLGSRVVAKLTVSRFGYRTQVVTSRPTRVVRTVPAMGVVAARGVGGVAVVVSMRAPGVGAVNGLVLVRSHGRVVGKVLVRNGVGRAVIRSGVRGRTTLRFTSVQTSKIARVTVRRVLRAR